MLTVLYPEVIHDLKDFHADLWPHNLSDGSMLLIVKISMISHTCQRANNSCCGHRPAV